MEYCRQVNIGGTEHKHSTQLSASLSPFWKISFPNLHDVSVLLPSPLIILSESFAESVHFPLSKFYKICANPLKYKIELTTLIICWAIIWRLAVINGNTAQLVLFEIVQLRIADMFFLLAIRICRHIGIIGKILIANTFVTLLDEIDYFTFTITSIIEVTLVEFCYLLIIFK